jgi:hypothetical protein
MTLRLSPALDVAALRQSFGTRRRLHVPGVLASDSADSIAAALEGEARAAEKAGDRVAAARAWRRAAQVPYGGRDAHDRRIAEALRLER